VEGKEIAVAGAHADEPPAAEPARALLVVAALGAPLLGLSARGGFALRIAGGLDRGHELPPAGVAAVGLGRARKPRGVGVHHGDALGDGSALGRRRAAEEEELAAAASDRLVVDAQASDLMALLLERGRGVRAAPETRKLGPIALALRRLREGGLAGDDADQQGSETGRPNGHGMRSTKQASRQFLRSREMAAGLPYQRRTRRQACGRDWLRRWQGLR
jgi:hypothetical protein